MYVPVISVVWIVIPTYVILLACFTTDIIGNVCMPYGFYSSVAAKKAITSSTFLVEYLLPIALMIFWYTRVVYTLRTKVTTRQGLF